MSYYHAFTVGFNVWMIWVPVSIYAMFVMGQNKYRYKWYREERKLKIVREYDNRIMYVAMGVATSVLAILLFVESARGIVQYFDNHLVPGDSPVWSYILLIFAILVTCSLYWIMLCFVANYFADRTKERLKKNRRQKEEELKQLN